MSTEAEIQRIRNDARLVRKVRVITHRTELPPTPLPHRENAWSMRLLLVEGNGSIQIRMRAERGHREGKFEIISTRIVDEPRKTALQTLGFDVANGVRVCDLVNMIFSRGRHNYNMTKNNIGVRWWLYVVFQDWNKSGWLKDDAPPTLYHYLLFRYEPEKPRAKLPMVEGSFADTKSN